jgi:hypothetical protein
MLIVIRSGVVSGVGRREMCLLGLFGGGQKRKVNTEFPEIICLVAESGMRQLLSSDRR